MKKSKTISPRPKRQPADLPREPREADAESLLLGPDADVDGYVVRGWKAEGLDLRQLRLDSTVVQSASIPRATIRSARWKDVRFVECDLANVEIRGLNAVRTEFAECRMTGIRMAEADCQSLLVAGGDQRYAQFRFAKFQHSEFDVCDLEDADFYGADLRGCIFRRCNLRNVEFSKAKLEGTDLRGSNLEGLRLGLEDIAGSIIDAAQALELVRLLRVTIL